MAKAHVVDMTTGSISKKFIPFVIPLILTNLMQQLYTSADNAVVGRYAGSEALAAVGASGHSTVLILNLLIGLSIGSNIINSNLLGKGDKEGLYRSMHTGIPLAFIGGFLIGLVGIMLAPAMMAITNCPEGIEDNAIMYMRLIFCGAPATLVYNVGAGILRTHGDSKRPLYIMLIAGITNVILNLIFVIYFKMSVAGVATATIISKYLSATLICIILFNPKGNYKMKLRDLKLRKQESWEIIRVGVPCGINSTVFSIANTIIQSGLNNMGSTVIAGSTAANGTVNLIYQVQAAIYTGCINFSGQCFGAGKYKRIDNIAKFAITLCVSITALAAAVVSVFPAFFIGIFDKDPAVIKSGTDKLILMAWSYILYGVVDVFMGCLRGMRQTAYPSLINIFCVCGIRVIWVWFILPFDPMNQILLYSCYPISYIFSLSALMIYYFKFRKKISLQHANT